MNAKKIVVDSRTEWNDIPYAVKFVWMVALLLVISAFGIFIRPDNPSSNYILREYGIDTVFTVFILFCSGVLMPLAYKYKPDLQTIMVLSLPGVLLYAALVLQVAQSDTAPILHLVVYSALIGFIGLCHRLILTLDATKAANVALAKELQTLKQKPSEKG